MAVFGGYLVADAVDHSLLRICRECHRALSTTDVLLTKSRGWGLDRRLPPSVATMAWRCNPPIPKCRNKTTQGDDQFPFVLCLLVDVVVTVPLLSMSEAAISFSQIRTPLEGGSSSWSWMRTSRRVPCGAGGAEPLGKHVPGHRVGSGLVPTGNPGESRFWGAGTGALSRMERSARFDCVLGPCCSSQGLLSNMTLFNNVLLPLRYHCGLLPARQRQLVMVQLEQLG